MNSVVHVRSAREDDVPAINSIHAHYVRNTVSTFALEPYSDERAQDSYRSIVSAGLPYLIAVDDADEVLGYAYLSPFRSAKGGYLFTAELSLYCHPAHQARGIGSTLLRIEVTQCPDQYGDEWIGRRGNTRIREIISCMSVDTTAREEGEGLASWYEKFGFERAGRLKRVGWKSDRWIDTIYLQKHLE